MIKLKIAIVTGASSGMGKEFVLQMAEKYSKLDEIWVISRRKEKLTELALDVTAPLRCFAFDISNNASLSDFANELESQSPDVKLLINCAGYGKYGEFATGNYEDEIGMIDVNCKGLTAITHMVLPYMSKKSRIINVASAAAFSPQPDFAVYAATKAYVLSFSRALNRELLERGISVTAVCPGPVKTAFFETAYNDEKIPLLKRLTMADAKKVVQKAIKDAALSDELSVYGVKMKIFRIAAKLLPHRFILSLMKKKA